MKKMTGLFIALISNLIIFAQQPSAKEKSDTKVYKNTPPAGALLQPVTPDIIWGRLFTDIQMNRILGDNKTFVDAIPKYEPDVILRRYAALKKGPDSINQMKDFVTQNFKIPVTYNAEMPAKTNSLKDHLEALWPVLTRKADVKEKYSSLLPLPEEYVVPGGRFREIYYWDSYFTMQGLAVSNRYDLIEKMLNNFKYLIDTYGHIPNGNRSYYLSRSQPPYFALMVDLLHQKMGDRVYKKYLPAMQKEYNWWMEGEQNLQPGQQHRRVVKLPDGTIMNRYFDDKKAPRQESYFEDVKTAAEYGPKDKMAYTNLRAGAESGWDFSSRWLADTMHLSTIETTDIVPVDLNCLLYSYERVIEKALASMQRYTQSKTYHTKALKRRMGILKYCWNEQLHFFFDYQYKKRTTTNRWSLAGVLPLFSKIAIRGQAGFVKDHIEKKFLQPGGLLTTPYHTGQQWDAPNGWAPLQYLAVEGLKNYGYDSLARTIATRWMDVNEKVYENTGKMMEKYNVENIHLESGGGEYPSQDGFGWSNGVYLKFKEMFGK